MKILHLNGFTTEERNAFKPVIASNTVGSMRVLLSALEELEGIPPLSDDCFEAAKRVMDEEGEYFRGIITPQLAADLNKLWHNSSIKKAYDRSAEFQLNDSAGYYLGIIEQIGHHDYIPSVQDVLRSRTKTTGILEMNFVLQGVPFKMVDVGGQRSERKKWMHCFQDVTAVIFCVGMSEYDLRLYEDDSTNRMHESLKLFREICNTKWFASTAMILFLNKRDLFQEKIKRIDLNVCFPEYQGGKNYDKASEFVKRQFMAQSENPKKAIYPHFTCATDTDNIAIVFNAVKDIILNQTLTDAGMVI
eukprot:TRINITY_DN1706_c0_g1_i1.p1 TRINITY_DN1706_c0_g1~~TRINITY_DN1706_c0_g1_i1.p1  ORF type:complete len:304 (-),score=57.53 TRINITY_DN1706_c0_g1_i1:95-1006(-)